MPKRKKLDLTVRKPNVVGLIAHDQKLIQRNARLLHKFLLNNQVVRLEETYYGEGEVRGDKTSLLCLFESYGGPRRPPRYRLVLDVRVPVEGPMAIRTVRYAKIRKDGSWGPGRPTQAVLINYDPDPAPPGNWRGRMEGEWPVRLVRIRRRSRWERLRRA